MISCILSSVLLLSLICLRCSALAGDNRVMTLSDFRPPDFAILSDDGRQVIGHAQYRLFASEGMEVLRGESTYFSGEHDIEVGRLKPGLSGQAPTLTSYEHSFFNSDQSYQRVSSLDVSTGIGSCKTYVDHKLEERRSHVTVLEDTYAGASIILFVMIRLRQRINHIKFHAFNCVPGPKIIATEALMRTNRRVKWPMYPGNLITMEMRPDFGWADFLIAPFIGKMYAWFDPSDNWNYVGGVYDRFYRGPRILTVLAPRTGVPKG